ncbi:MAG TPA: sigma-70 family RNA polymerase sigma factor [Armatimonadota bacterium]|jgi:RNA polymerase sigma-70 factor (ECF subfamily)
MPEGAVSAQQEYALVRRVQAGDDAAFDRLVELCSGRVYSLALRMVGNADDAQDIAQEAFVRVYQALPRFRQDAAFSTWLYRIVVNTCHDELARRPRRPVSVSELTSDDEMPSPLDLATTDDTPETALLQRERQRALETALAELPAQARMVIILHDIQGLSYQEMAEILHAELGTIKSRLNRARNQMREKIYQSRELFNLETSQSS